MFEYNIAQNKWSLVHEGTSLEKPSISVPIRRSGLSMTTSGTSLYIFGGKCDDGRLNDLW